MTPLLQVRGLSCGYGTADVLHDISIDVNAGELTAIIGSNGAGKSTLLRAISGLLPTRRGEILFAGQPIHRRRAEQIAALGIAHVPEGRRVFPDQTTENNIYLGAYKRMRSAGRAAVRRDVDAMLERFPSLAERKHSPAGFLSGGEQQMLAIARALMGRPKLLMLDEPSLGLAPIIIQDVLKLLAEERERGTTILLIEQLAQVALSIAGSGFVLNRGRVVLEGRADALLSDPAIAEAYLGRPSHAGA
ncbi:MAG TPA: ABC transporter ATP-binding protein [Methyloceanibacter sp.]|nr:ABC transporter ATP-binding protein [Methyloceanibacter sp.]